MTPLPSRHAACTVAALVVAGCASQQGEAPVVAGAPSPPGDALARDPAASLTRVAAGTEPDTALRAGLDRRAGDESAIDRVSIDALDARPTAPETHGLPPDPILSSSLTGDRRIEERMAWWLDFWTRRASESMAGALGRMGRYEEYIAAELSARGLPASLRFLPLTEAHYVTTAISPAGAGGLWQFMPATARWLGLRVDGVVDARLDPFAATPRALDYIVELKEQFDSWFLTLAAYNAGPGRVERAIRDHGGGMPRTDALFIQIRPHLPGETRDFIPKFLATVRFGIERESRGLSGPERDPPLRIETVQVAEAASLDALARAAGVERKEIARLNPHLRLGHTPPGRTTAVRLPRGRAGGFEERLAQLPARERAWRHLVAEGETLWQIARYYGIPVAALEAANPQVRPRTLRIGSFLALPDHDLGSGTGQAPARAARDGLHVVSRGDTLWQIARRYGVTVGELRALNEIGEGSLIRPGETVRIPLGR